MRTNKSLALNVIAWRSMILAVFLSVSLSSALAGEKGDKGDRHEKALAGEVSFSTDDFKNLETFEAHMLTKADKVFAAKEYKQAESEYESFVLEHEKSKAVPYALLRKARCIHLGNKRFEAIKAYQEVLDYFPNVVNYAAPALYYIGLCHFENGDEEKAIKSWSKMADDAEYAKHPLASPALLKLGENLQKNGSLDRAINYYRLVAINFRMLNPESSKAAIDHAVEYYLRKPSEADLREFYQKVKGFDIRPGKIPANLDEDLEYWNTVRGLVRRHDDFKNDQTALKDQYFKYWSTALAGKFADVDDYQVDVFHFQLMSEKDEAKWMERLDQQFTRFQKPGDYTRTLKWMSLYKNHKTKAMEYFGKIDFAGMKNSQILSLLKLAYDQLQDAPLGRNVYEKLNKSELTDGGKKDLARYFTRKDPELVKDLCMMMKDKDLGMFTLLEHYVELRDAEKGIPIADKLAQLPQYSRESLMRKAMLLFLTEQYEQAIPVFQQADLPPETLWKISECYSRLGKVAQAIGQLTEVENYFKDLAPEAALRMAHVYKVAGDEKKRIAALRNVLKKYPKSTQSSRAHLELESMGAKIGGGVDADQ